jgi:membrane-associated phospholipid phosphatase
VPSFQHLPLAVLRDQKTIWTSPFHLHRQNAKWWLLFAGTTAGLIAADRRLMTHVPRSGDNITDGTWGSRLGGAYTLVPVSAGSWLIGAAAHDAPLRDTGLLALESLADTTLVVTALKYATARERPTAGAGAGHFWAGGSSFPSGHSISTWGVATVIAKRYPHRPLVAVLAYGAASTVAASRIAARQHFPADVVAGSAMGYFIGDFVTARHRDPESGGRPSAMERVLAHVRISID